MMRNTFDPHEDVMLWELHEIRHELHQILRHQTIEHINAEYHEWQKTANTIPLMPVTQNYSSFIFPNATPPDSL